MLPEYRMATTNSANTRLPGTARKQLLLTGGLLLILLGLLFFRSFLPGVVHFNNDTPLGFMKPLADNGVSDSHGPLE